jgi:PKD repeat protein
MRKLSIFTLLLSLLSGYIFGQCPTASFTLPDTICQNSSIQLINSSIGNSLKYSWDFNSADFKNNITDKVSGTYPASLGASLGIDYALDNGNYFAFAVNTSGNLTRFDFGNSLDNTPAINSLGNLGLLASTVDFQLLNDNGNWYALTNSFNNSVYRLDFGNSLTTIPTVVTLNIPTNLFSTPYYLTAEKIGNNYIAIICNYSGGNSTIIDFGSSLTNNTPNAFNINLPNSNPISAVLTSECDSIFAIVGYAAGFPMVMINFGTLVSPTPLSITPLLTNSGASFRRLELIKEESEYYVLAHSFGGESMQLFNFGNHINNLSPTIKNLGPFNSIVSGCYTYCLNKSGSSWNGFSTNYSSGELIKFKFNEQSDLTTNLSQAFEPTTSFSQSGLYSVTLTVTDSITHLSNSFSDSVYVGQSPNPGFIYSSACQGYEIFFVDTTKVSDAGIAHSTWDFDNGNTAIGDSVSNTFFSIGDYAVTLEVESTLGCINSIVDTINVAPLPTAQFLFTDNQCEENNVSFINNSVPNQGFISSYFWNFGDNSSSNDSVVSHSYNVFGNYNVELIVKANGCVDTSSQTLSIIEKPNASVNVFNTCVDETVFFQNNSTFSGGGISSSIWNFGDGQTSTLTSPNHQYSSNPSQYNIQLIQIASNGCIDTLNQILQIGFAPSPSFSISTDTACVGNTIVLIDSSIAFAGDTIIARYWDFGDNYQDSTSTNVTHQYNSPGLYTISLTVVSPSNCDSTITKNIVVIESPTSNFTSTDVCLGFNNLFTDISTTPTGSVLTNWNWNFGDTNTSNQQNTTNTYLQSGIYNVTLVVTNSAGCYDSITKSVLVYSIPQPKFGFTKACTDKEVAFTDSSTVNNSTITVWNWNFGDNTSPSTTQNTNHIYSASAAYPVTLTTTTAYGCVDSLTKYILVDQSPQFNITASDTCFRLSNKFTYSPIGAPLPTANFLWNFGDSTFAFQSNPNHLYTQPGSYPVSLLVTDLNTGCNTQINDTVSVYALPKSEFSIQNSCINDSLRFIDLSTTSSGAVTSWKWVIGTYGNSILQNPAIVINVADSFLVKQVVASNFGCKDSSSNYAVVYPLPLVSFTQNVSYGGPPLIVNFTNTSNANQYEWNFGDGSSLSAQLNPTHVYNAIGNYNTTLVATSSKGCIDSSSTTITVLNPALDLALEAISYTENNGLWEIKCKVRNLGNLDINSFTLSAQLEGKSQISETIENLALVAGQSKDFIFSSKFLADDSDNPNYLCVKVVDVNGIVDDNRSNDNRCVTTSKEFEIFEAYPNPFNQDINIGINAPNLESVSISIFSIEGKKIVDDKIYELQKGFNTVSIENLHLLSGIYFLQILQGENLTVKKLLKN